MYKLTMPLLLLLVLFIPRAHSATFDGPYLDTIVQHPLSIPYSVGGTFDTGFNSNGGMTLAGMVWHKPSRTNTLMPNFLLDIGVEPIGWALGAGIGGNAERAFAPLGISVNLAPTVLGPLLKLMNESGNPALKGLSKILYSPNGGVSLAKTWTAYPIDHGTVMPFNAWRFPPGWFVGAMWTYK